MKKSYWIRNLDDLIQGIKLFFENTIAYKKLHKLLELW